MRRENGETSEERRTVETADAEESTAQTAPTAGEVTEETDEAKRVATAQEKKKHVQKEILSWIITLGSAVLIALMIRTFLFEPIRVDGSSMRDTLQNNEIMFVTKPEYLFGDPQREDVVICKYPGRTENFVKRLMGVPGDTIEVRDFVVYVNGEAVDEPYLTPTNNDDASSANMDPVTLGEDEYFVMGDNRDNSHDCRNYYGYGKPATLTRSQIIGHVRFVIFPFNQVRTID
ncbi:MAG: signal peptidase I [Eubacteriales bacterium]|nr:signal peptidase I [Eubacteriales bacterium]